MSHLKKRKSVLPRIVFAAGLLFFSVCLPLGAQLFSDNARLFTIKTEFFDIIYPASAENSARLLAENADEMYRKTAEFFGVTADLRFPVVITPDTSLLNAYFTAFPYNRIVLFDTLPSDGSLAVFKDSFLSVFGHELTHAVTSNIKSPFWRGASRVFGDILSPSMVLNMVPSFIEGSAVLTESLGGDGRLNDPAVMQVLLQAKLENKFPSWKEASGARDIYPSGDLPYLYGGAFAFYIFQKYGRQKFAEFWQRAGKVQFALTAGIFKKTYGIPLEKEWLLFTESLPLPAVTTEKKAGVKKLQSGGRYASLAASGEKLVWIDKASSSVLIKTGQNEIETLLMYGMLERVSLSTDGKLLLLSAAEYDGYLFYDRTRLYDIEAASFLPSVLPLRDACFVDTGDVIASVAGISVFSQQSSLVLYRGSQKTVLANFPQGVTAFSPVDCGNGWISCILDEKNERSLAFFNISTGESKKTKVGLPTGSVFNSLSLIDGVEPDSVRLSFSWTEKNSLSRAGFITINFETLESVTSLSNLELSGGVNVPVVQGDCLTFIARFFDYDAVYTVGFPDFEIFSSQPLVETVLTFAAAAVSAKPEKRYNPFSYFGKGVLVPVAVNALVPSGFIDFGYLGLGLTWFTMDPAEKYSILGSGGYDFITQTASFYAQFAGTASPVHWNAEAGITFDTSLYTLFRAGFTASYTKPLRDSISFWYFEDKLRAVTDFKLWRVANTFQVYFSNVHKTGSGYFEAGGVKFGVANIFLVNPVETEFYGIFGFTIPFFLPFKNPEGFTLNLPLTTDLNAGLQSLVVSSTVVLFSAEIQKGIPFLPFYVQRFTLEGSYEGRFLWKGGATGNKLGAVAYVTFSPLAGVVTNVRIDAGMRFLYDFIKKNWQLSFAGAFRL